MVACLIVIGFAYLLVILELRNRERKADKKKKIDEERQLKKVKKKEAAERYKVKTNNLRQTDRGNTCSNCEFEGGGLRGYYNGCRVQGFYKIEPNCVCDLYSRKTASKFESAVIAREKGNYRDAYGDDLIRATREVAIAWLGTGNGSTHFTKRMKDDSILTVEEMQEHIRSNPDDLWLIRSIYESWHPSFKDDYKKAVKRMRQAGYLQ